MRNGAVPSLPSSTGFCARKGTERPFTGQYAETDTPGVYLCAACGLELFPSETKFDSGCGWPSFYDPLDKEHVEEHEDRSHGMSPHRGHLLALRRSSRPRLSRRPEPHRPALLHQLRLPAPGQEMSRSHRRSVPLNAEAWRRSLSVSHSRARRYRARGLTNPSLAP